MRNLEIYSGQEPAWCPGCGNFHIQESLKEALAELELAPHQFTIVSGIGQGAKMPHYLKCHTFNGLHGRTLPVATGLRLANHEMRVIAEAGDGDCYGEGGNHLLHAIRRNINVKLFVHNNQIYGLTKGQASPTTLEGVVTKTQPFGSFSEALNPLALAVALDCSFVARGFAGDGAFLKDLMKEALTHQGFALLDILQPCVTFNKVNTHQWYSERAYRLEESYDPFDRIKAFERTLEWGAKIPIGIIYRNKRRTFEEKVPILQKLPLMKQPFSIKEVADEVNRFY